MPVSKSQRLRRGQQGGARKGGGSGAASSSSNDDEDALVLTGSCTFVIALMIVGLGAALAVLFFSIHQPECMKGLSFGLADTTTFKAADGATTPKLRRKLTMLLQEEEAEGDVLLK